MDTSKSIEEVMATMHGSAKNKFATMFELLVATAAQNSLPTVFGRSKQGVDMSVHLPGIPTLKHWDTMEGTQGMVYKITEDLPNAQHQ
eukprot:1147334-Ditylum_brightwellii.AAC.1